MHPVLQHICDHVYLYLGISNITAHAVTRMYTSATRNDIVCLYSTVKTCAPVSVANSAVTPVKSTYNYDDSVTYTCNVGYENTGGPLSRTCTDTNTWSGSVPVCTTSKFYHKGNKTLNAMMFNCKF